jgi:hypothetical protein
VPPAGVVVAGGRARSPDGGVMSASLGEDGDAPAAGEGRAAWHSDISAAGRSSGGGSQDGEEDETLWV